MGTKWWQYGSLEEGVRIGYHGGDIDREGWARDEQEERLCREARKRKKRGKRVLRGEEPDSLMLVDEGGPSRFEIVRVGESESAAPDVGRLIIEQ